MMICYMGVSPSQRRPKDDVTRDNVLQDPSLNGSRIKKKHVPQAERTHAVPPAPLLLVEAFPPLDSFDPHAQPPEHDI